MQPFEQQEGDQGCPNLDAQGVFAGADEGLHSEILLQRLEKQLDLPALFVDGGNRGGAEFQQVGEQDDFPLVVGIPNYDAAQRAGTVGQGLNAGEANDLVSTNITILRSRELRFDGKGGI